MENKFYIPVAGKNVPENVHPEANRSSYGKTSTMANQVSIKNGELLREFKQVTQELVDVLMAFDESEINSVPVNGGWTAGQVGEHLFKSDTAILNALYGPVKKTWREPDVYVEDIRAMLLDFSTEVQARDFILPTEDVCHDKYTLIVALKSYRELINKAIRALDLSVTCTDPLLCSVVGEWTRFEYVHFLVAHTHRHIFQLKEIHSNLQRARA
jgi:hypothetical protein